MIIDDYNDACNVISDINEHLPVLKRYADEVSHITEFGVRWVSSTKAFLASSASTLISYDILTTPEIKQYIQKCAELNVPWVYIEQSTLECVIEETDLLFIDTLHTYTQLIKELELHANKVRKYIICHDTSTFARRGMDDDNKGLMDAIDEFLEDNNEWIIHEHSNNNNGLTILRRINNEGV